jgi:hypothetical protein
MPTPTTLADHLANLIALASTAELAVQACNDAYEKETRALRAHTLAAETNAAADVIAALRDKALAATAVADAACHAKRDALEKAAEAAAFLSRFA